MHNWDNHSHCLLSYTVHGLIPALPCSKIKSYSHFSSNDDSNFTVLWLYVGCEHANSSEVGQLWPSVFVVLCTTGDTCHLKGQHFIYLWGFRKKKSLCVSEKGLNHEYEWDYSPNFADCVNQPNFLIFCLKSCSLEMETNQDLSQKWLLLGVAFLLYSWGWRGINPNKKTMQHTLFYDLQSRHNFDLKASSGVSVCIAGVIHFIFKQWLCLCETHTPGFITKLRLIVLSIKTHSCYTESGADWNKQAWSWIVNERSHGRRTKSKIV